MLTYQDFLAAKSRPDFLLQAVREHQASPEYKLAQTADLYDHRKNKTINEYVKTIYTLSGEPLEDFTASNNKIASNFFHRLNTQRCTYSLGNGVTFTQHIRKTVNAEGLEETTDETKEQLGPKFDTDLKRAGYLALIHGVTFCFWDLTRLQIFPLTQFVPLWDEEDGTLKAGIRFWQLDPKKPMQLMLYELGGVTRYQTKEAKSGKTVVVARDSYPQPYKTTTEKAPADPEEKIVDAENYSFLPVVPLWGSDLHQSTMVGMQEQIDSYDLIRSGFANDLTDVSQIFWILENYGGMKNKDLEAFRNRLLLNHVATADTSNGGKITPYAQDIPHEARDAYLEGIRKDIYEGFGALDVHQVSADSTNDHLEAAYQPLDENADDFEFQIIEFVQQLLSLLGIEDTPEFKRNRISNQREQVDMIIAEKDAGLLDRETAIGKLPNVSPDERQGIIARLDAEDGSRFEEENPEDEDQNPNENEDEEDDAE